MSISASMDLFAHFSNERIFNDTLLPLKFILFVKIYTISPNVQRCNMVIPFHDIYCAGYKLLYRLYNGQRYLKKQTHFLNRNRIVLTALFEKRLLTALFDKKKLRFRFYFAV
ncbi:MAG: hypothetical protein DCC60_09660 [Ignavibacteriae bacterium]|nr:MAG: hypothetical protein DCC60_09660 [Ignavibacteriota bacterium]